MIVEYIRYALKDHSPEQLMEGYRQAATHLRAAPECLGFDLTQCVEEPSLFVLRIHWTSAEAHLGGFRKGPHFGPFLQWIRPFVGEIAEMRHYAPSPVAWTREPSP